jgi:hypothetical protein
MEEYLLSVEMDCYGPYHSEEQARFARFLFTTRHPDLAPWCTISPIPAQSDYAALLDPRLLH